MVDLTGLLKACSGVYFGLMGFLGQRLLGALGVSGVAI